MTRLIENYLPPIMEDGYNSAKNITTTGTVTASNLTTSTNNIALTGTLSVGGATTLTGTTLASDSITVASGKSIIGAGTGANGITLKNLKNSAATALSGTQLDITIDIGGTPYYFTVYPTKA